MKSFKELGTYLEAYLIAHTEKPKVYEGSGGDTVILNSGTYYRVRSTGAVFCVEDAFVHPTEGEAVWVYGRLADVLPEIIRIRTQTRTRRRRL